jgi:hypothetical protein
MLKRTSFAKRRTELSRLDIITEDLSEDLSWIEVDTEKVTYH